MKLHAFVSRGLNQGKLLYPHLHEDGRFVVSLTRFKDDYIYLKSGGDILGYLERGYSLRMSNPAEGITAPSLVSPSSIYRPVVSS